MSERTMIRKIVVSGDRKFETNLEYGRVKTILLTGEEWYYILHTENNHWEENLFVFKDPQVAMRAMSHAAGCLAQGLEVPRSFEGTAQVQLKF
jgi:hypothetical protein